MELTSKDFKKVLKSDIPVMIEFWGSWCPPCQGMKTVMNNLEKNYEGRIKIAKINVDRNPEPSMKYDICGVPTYIIFQNGEIIHRDVGAKSEQQLRKIIEKVI